MDRGNATSISIKESNLCKDVRILERNKEVSIDNKTVRVAAYCRVSTKQDMQASSLETQISSYRRIIEEHPGWELAGIYADEGISGTSVKKRKEFRRMIRDAEEGKIDYIIAKSTSRFARNTMDTLEYTRKLKEMGIGVYFEEQKLDTNGVASELLLTIHASFAQEESRSLSENLKKANRSRYAMGIAPWSPTFGLRKSDDGNWELDPEESQTVKEIFTLYNSGMSLIDIKSYLEENERRSPGGGEIWHTHTLSNILKNEKYIGDVEMQKSYTKDYLTKTKVINKNMDIPKYYKENNHPATVSRDDFIIASTSLKMKDCHRGAAQYPFYGVLKCPCCGENMVSVRLPSRMKKHTWVCGGASNGEIKIMKRSNCDLYSVCDEYIHLGVRKALDSLDDDYLLSKKKPEATELVDEKKKDWKKVEYYFLYKYVNSITFDLKNGDVDFNTLVIDWKFGKKTKVHIDYEKANEIPVRRHEIDLFEDEYIVRGKATNGTNKAYLCVNNILDFIEKIEIHEDDETEKIKIPKVIAPNSYRRKEW